MNFGRMKYDKKQIAHGILVSIIIILGIFFRIWWINNVPTEQKYDFKTYHELAQNIYAGLGHTLEGEPVAWQGCGYSYLLGYYYKITGSTSEYNGKIFNVILSSFTLILSYFIYRKLYKKNSFVLFPLCVTAVFPNIVAYNNVLGTETLSLFIMTCLLFLTVFFLFEEMGTKKKIALYISIGFLCGLGALIKPYLLVYPVIISVIYWVNSKNLLKSIFLTIIVFSAATLVVAPWTYRNYRYFGRFIPVSYNGGYVLYVNSNESNITGTWMDITNIKVDDALKSKISAILDNRKQNIKIAHDVEPLLKEEAKKWIMNNPGEYLKLAFLRVKATFFEGTNDVSLWAMNGLEYNLASDNPRDVRYFVTLISVFDVILYITSSSAFLFLFVNLKKYALACFTFKNKISIPQNVIFINIAFFIVIFFIFEGHARYNMPTLIFLISALGLVVEKLQD